MDTEKDPRTRASFAASPAEPHLFLVLQGNDPVAGGARYGLHGVDEVTLSRGERRAGHLAPGSRRLAIEIADRTISTTHARLRRHDGGGWRLEDLGSTNGTLVNGRPVREGPLADGDLVEIGQTVLRLRVALPTPENAEGGSAGADGAFADAGVPTLRPDVAGELAAVARVAQARVPILLLGETGTGKEVVARAVHAASGRTGPFVSVNCAALPAALVEAQLFGHTKGAFSGALRDEPGFVRSADKGTLLLDEIGDLPPQAQGALLRVLQDGEVVPVGSSRPVAVDMRVISATHQPIDAMLERGTFRRDLFARLEGFTHRLRPLAERVEDVGLLVAHHLRAIAPDRAADVSVAPRAIRALVSYAWPHNVRELVQVLSRSVALADEGLIDVAHLPAAVAACADEPPARRRSSKPPKPLTEPDAALRVDLVARLESHGGNVAAVAREMSKAPMQV